MTTKPLSAEFGLTTWNMHTRGLRNLARHRATIAQEVEAGVVVFLLQEVFGTVPHMLRDLGLRVYLAHPAHKPTSPAGKAQTAVAWHPARFHKEGATTLDLNRTLWGPKGKVPDIVSYLALVYLRDLVTGDRVVFGSYHTAPRVQVPESIRPWRRFQSLVEAARVWRRVGRAHRVVIIGGDSNVDVKVGRGGPWSFLRRSATGFRIVHSRRGTLDGSPRAIDQVRVKGPVWTSTPTVTPVPESDHHVVRVRCRVLHKRRPPS